MPTPPEPRGVDTPPTLITGADPNRLLDALFVNAPLRDYAQRPRVNDFTLPVLGMGYLASQTLGSTSRCDERMLLGTVWQ